METDSDFRAQLEARIDRFLAQRDELRKQLVEFNHALNAVEKRLETAVEMYRLEFEADPPQVESTGQQLTAPRVGRPGESWNTAIEAVLTEAGAPLHITEIWNRVQKRGFTTTAKDPLRAIASVLVRHPQAKRTDPNTYALPGKNGSVPRLQQTLVTIGDNAPPQDQETDTDD
jgi:hypothetical protein